MNSLAIPDGNISDSQLDISSLDRLVSVLKASPSRNGRPEKVKRLSESLGLSISPGESIESVIRWLEEAHGTLTVVADLVEREITFLRHSFRPTASRRTDINELPDELLMHIMKDSIPLTPYFSDWNGAVTLSQVCRRFRLLSLKSPSLWTCLTSIRSLTETRMFLDRSKGQKLQIYIFDKHQGRKLATEAFLEAVLNHRDRWNLFRLDVEDDYAGNVGDLRTFLSSISPLCGAKTFPALKTFILECAFRWYNIRDIWQSLESSYTEKAHFYTKWSCPKLNVVILKNFIPHLSPIITHPLRDLRFLQHVLEPPLEPPRLDVKRILDILRLQPTLQTLEINVTGVELFESKISEAVPLLNLRELVLEFDTDRVGLSSLEVLTASVSTPNIVTLDLQICYIDEDVFPWDRTRCRDWSRINKWLDIGMVHADSWTRLKTVHVGVSRYDGGPCCGFHRILQLPNLTNLSIEFDELKAYNRASLWNNHRIVGSLGPIRQVHLSGIEGFSSDSLVVLLQRLEKEGKLDKFQELEVIRCPSFSGDDAEKVLPRSKIVWVD